MTKSVKAIIAILLATISVASTSAFAASAMEINAPVDTVVSEVTRTPIYKAIKNWRVAYTSLDKVEDPYYYDEYDPEYNATFKGLLDLDRVEKVGSVYYAYYSGDVIAYI